jgi:deoxyhypusine synthase
VRSLIDDGFQAFNAARLGEACRIFSDKMLLPEHDTTIGLTVAGALTPAGLGGCVVELMERGFCYQYLRQPLSRSALRPKLHAASRLSLCE